MPWDTAITALRATVRLLRIGAGLTLAIHQRNNFVGVEHAAWKIVIGVKDPVGS
jgi:hypothetical protein